jgi:Flp pilus assembly protein TadB
MPDDEDEPDNLLQFRPLAKPDKSGRKRQSGIAVDPEDLITAGAAIVALVLAVAMASQWVPINVYTIGIVACCGAGFVIAKLIRAKRPSGPVTKHRRNGR